MNTSKMENNQLGTFIDLFSKHLEDTIKFNDFNEELPIDAKLVLKDLYDFTKSEETRCNVSQSGSALKKLIIENFDLEQIWQQLELQNKPVIEHMVKELSSALVAKDRLIFSFLSDELSKVENSSQSDAESHTSSTSTTNVQHENEVIEDHPIDISSDESDSENEDAEDDQHSAKKFKGSVVDDDFFKLNEMEEFLRKEENPSKVPNDSQSESDEGDIDFFGNDSEEDEEEGDEAKVARFKDYFVSQEQNEPKRKKNRLMQELEEGDNESEEDTDENTQNDLKSSLELRQERLNKKIQHLEDQAIDDKPWPLKGEITGQTRPQNSLLEQVLDFDLTSRPAPIITEQASLQLEDIIRQRIKDKAFDSMEKITRPIDTPLEFKKKLVLDQEKSKESLANIYEKEFLAQQAALDKDKMDSEEAEPELHKEVKTMMKSLFTKLDALSNFHFTTTPAVPELKVIKNLPAVSMEEVAPVAVSDAALLAPEEIKTKPKGDIIGKNERTSADKKRERRKKKLKQKIHSKRKAKANESSSKKNRVKA